MTCGNVPVARQADVGVHGAAHGDGVAAVLDGQLILHAAVAVAGGRVDARGVDLRSALDGFGRHAGDLGDLFGRVLGHACGEVLPHGLDLGLAAVLQLHLELAVQRRIDGRVERGRIGNPTLAHAGHQMLLHAFVAGRGLAPRLAFPQAAVGVEVGHAVVQVVPHHELVRVAVFLQVAFLEQARLDLALAAGEAVDLVAGGLYIVANQERRVGPLLGEQVVVQIVVDQHVQPAHGHGTVGAGTQVQPDVGLLAQIGHARVHHDVRVGLLGDVDHGTARVIVVRKLRTGAPGRIHLRATDRLHPRCLHHGVQRGGEEARALAHLPRDAHVRAADQLAERAIREHAPDTAGARHAEDGLSAIAVHRLLQLLGDGAHRLVPADAHPTGIVLAAGVRALHGMVQAVGVIRRLQRRLALAAMVAHGLERALVAFRTDGATVLDDDPHAAFHLAAAAAAGTHALGLARLALGGAARLGQRGTRRRNHGSCGSGGGCQLRERAARHIQLAHALLLLSSSRSREYAAAASHRGEENAPSGASPSIKRLRPHCRRRVALSPCVFTTHPKIASAIGLRNRARKPISQYRAICMRCLTWCFAE